MKLQFLKETITVVLHLLNVRIIRCDNEESLSTPLSEKKIQLWKGRNVFSFKWLILLFEGSKLMFTYSLKRWFGADTQCKFIGCGGFLIYQPPSIT